MDYGSWARPVDQEQQRQQPFQLPLKIIILPSKIQYYTINTLYLPSRKISVTLVHILIQIKTVTFIKYHFLL